VLYVFDLLLERQRPNVVAFEREQIEHIQNGRGLNRRTPHLERPGHFGAVLEALEARPACLVRDAQLAVEDEPLVREGRQGAGDLGERGRDVVSVTRDEPRLSSLAAAADAVPVELELEQPSGFRERL